MAPSPPKPPKPAPPPPTIDQAAQQADANNLLRMRRGYAATVLSRGTQGGGVTGASGMQSRPATAAGTAAILGQ